MGDDDYGDDFDTEGPQEPAKKISSGLSLLKSAAKEQETIEKEETAAALARGAHEMKEVATLLGNKDRNADAIENGEEEDEDVELDGDEDDNFELNSALRQACNKGNLTQVKSLISKSANCKARDRHGWTSLHWAAKHGSSEIIDYLCDSVESGDKYPFVNAKDSISGWSALMVACMSGNVETVRSLVSRGANVNARNLLGEVAADFISGASVSKNRQIRRILGIEEKDESKESDREESKGGDTK